ncbi:MAG: hypothetical protein ACTSRZ_05765 [Promethearchaeota archaeon]
MQKKIKNLLLFSGLVLELSLLFSSLLLNLFDFGVILRSTSDFELVILVVMGLVYPIFGILLYYILKERGLKGEIVIIINLLWMILDLYILILGVINYSDSFNIELDYVYEFFYFGFIGKSFIIFTYVFSIFFDSKGAVLRKMDSDFSGIFGDHVSEFIFVCNNYVLAVIGMGIFIGSGFFGIIISILLDGWLFKLISSLILIFLCFILRYIFQLKIDGSNVLFEEKCFQSIFELIIFREFKDDMKRDVVELINKVEYKEDQDKGRKDQDKGRKDQDKGRKDQDKGRKDEEKRGSNNEGYSKDIRVDEVIKTSRKVSRGKNAILMFFKFLMMFLFLIFGGLQLVGLPGITLLGIIACNRASSTYVFWVFVGLGFLFGLIIFKVIIAKINKKSGFMLSNIWQVMFILLLQFIGFSIAIFLLEHVTVYENSVESCILGGFFNGIILLCIIYNWDLNKPPRFIRIYYSTLFLFIFVFISLSFYVSVIKIDSFSEVVPYLKIYFEVCGTIFVILVVFSLIYNIIYKNINKYGIYEKNEKIRNNKN